MLPWAPLWHRLLIGFDQGLGATDPEMQFFIDPVEYLSREGDEGFERVLFVMPSNDGGPPLTPDTATTTPPFDEPMEPRKDGGPGEAAEPDELDLPGSNSASKLRKLRSGKIVEALAGAWEFIPYNDPATRPDNLLTFRDTVARYRTKLLGDDVGERTQALHSLRLYYRSKFAGSAMNDVSLMLYGGAVGDWQGWSYCNWSHGRSTWERFETRGAVLLTGDGNLSNAQKWKTLEAYLDVHRARGATVFQIPHHGSRHNWYPGLASDVSPKSSVISSEFTNKHGHPHAEVLRDFWPFNPIQVDQHGDYLVRIMLESL